jgi:hypothetical protein
MQVLRHSLDFFDRHPNISGSSCAAFAAFGTCEPKS